MLGLALFAALQDAHDVETSVRTCVSIERTEPQVAQLHGMPPRLSRPEDWQKLEPLPLTERTEVMLAWLVEERREPTPPNKGLGGGPIDTDYTQAQIVHSLANGDPRVLKWLVESKDVKPSAMRDLVGLALALSGDLGAKSHVLRALSDNKNPWIREKAAGFLAEWPDKETMTALEGALNDPFQIRYERTPDNSGSVERYPVREAAKHTLSVIGKGLKPNDWSHMWQEKHKESIKDYDSFVRERSEDLKRIASIVNKDTVRR